MLERNPFLRGDKEVEWDLGFSRRSWRRNAKRFVAKNSDFSALGVSGLEVC